MSNSLKRKLAIGVGFGIIVFIALALYGDAREMGRLLQGFRWQLIPAILLLTLVNYVLRGLRFHYYLRQVGVHSISWWASMRVFIGGFSLTLTPGKLGELVRVYWLKNMADAEPATVTPPIFVDRVVDGLAMAILAAFGILAFPKLWPVMIVVVSILILGIIIVQIRPLALWFLRLGEKLPFVSKFAHHLHALYESTYELLRFKNLMIGLIIGLLVWIAEGIALYLVLIGLGVAEGPEMMMYSTSTLSAGSLVGGASSLPGGLGAAEASMTGILQGVAGLQENQAVTATLMIRFFTLWFGVILGVGIVLIWRNMLFGSGKIDVEAAAASASAELPDSELTYEQTGS